MRVLRPISQAFNIVALLLRGGGQFHRAAAAKSAREFMPARHRAVIGVWLLIWLLPAVASEQVLTHRYSFFNEPNGSTVATDLVASANGAVKGNAVITGGQLRLDGSSGTYLNLPSGIISGYSAVTIETWGGFSALPVNCFFWGFGNTDSSGAGEDYLFCAPQAGRVAITGADPGWQGEQNANSAVNWSGQTNVHIVAVFNPPANSLALYTNGVLAAINHAITTPISAVNDVYSYIGRSLYTADPYAPLDVAEFRIYNGALNAQQVALDAASGPTSIIANPGALLSVQLKVANQMPAGGTQSAAVTGNFADVTNVNLFTYGPPTLISDNTNVLTVTASGLITAFVPGAAANIIASFGGLSATQNVTVSGYATNLFMFNSFGDGFWSIANQGNGNVLVETSGGASQEVYTNGAAEQQFEVLYNVQSGTFRLRQHSNWFCIGAQNNPPAVGGAVTFAPFYTAQSSQQWYLVNAGGGYYRIFNAASNLVLQTDNGTPASVTLARASASPFQLWQFNYQTHYPKKGCAGYEGDYSQFGLDWAYNYNDNTSVGLPASVDFAPMIHDANWEPLSDVQSRSAGWRSQAPPDYLLTYNEPDNVSQANMTTSQVLGLWPQLQALGVPLVSPAMQNTFDAWAYDFFSLISSNHYRVDYTAVHLYVPPNAASLIGDLQSAYTTWGRPVWLTEFSPVDWNNTQSWSENDDYNFLAEFMWQAEGQDWLKRYAIFPFSGTNSASPWVDNGYRGNFFLADGATLSPYGELYATWDGDLSLHTRTPYLIHNLGTSFRLTDNGSSSRPSASTIYVRNATTEWALLPAPENGHWYIISLNDGRRLRDNGGTLDLAPVGTTSPAVDWWFNGPDASGYYYLDNLAASQSIQGAGTAPFIGFSMVNDPAPSSATQWRLVKPYQPPTIATAAPPSLSITYSNQSVTLNWTGSGSFYNLYRGTSSGGPYTNILSLTTNHIEVDTTVQNGTAYYYVVTALNILGEESTYSSEVAAYPASTSPPLFNFSLGGNNLRFNWPADHTGWRLMVQTNNLASGISSNTNDWMTVAGSQGTNQISLPTDTTKPAEFYRLIYP
ncbi:MAG TPA: glycosyl hydrolase [Candidatus Acidoferrum sp.]|nr:glycosyl hydrolase [Candidatus Acidoferrum sp.]